ncbi:MAG: hypothetical protein ACO3C1_07155 [Ilumatobacteraceae bacterium]
MTAPADDQKSVLTSLWQAAGDPAVALDDECSPTKVCRNMQGITFEGFAEEGTDIRTAWRERLQREGKYNTSGGSIRDLVLGAESAS